MEKKRQYHFFLKTVLAFLTVSLFSLGNTAHLRAVEFNVGAAAINLDTTLSIGSSWRIEERDYDLVGKSNWPDYINNNSAYWATQGTGVIPPGAYSNNTDDGNLNFDKGDPISQLFKANSTLKIDMGNYGMKLQGYFFYDHYIMENDFDKYDITEDGEAERQHGMDLILLDAFVYTDQNIADKPLSVRLGRQVVNWGESTFIQHGISEASPIDAARIRVPGAEIKDALIPVGQFWGSFNFTDNIGMEGFYQFEFRHTEIDAPGTYFSTNDFMGAGGQYIQSMFAQYPEERQFGTANTPYLHVLKRLDDKDADDQGQFGMKCSWLAEALNFSEFGLYYMNYHSRRPFLSGYVHDGIPAAVAVAGQLMAPVAEGGMGLTQAQTEAYMQAPANQVAVGGMMATAATNPFVYMPGDTYADGREKWGGISGYIEYPEDIQLLGMSFNTALPGGLALAGEYSYRMDEPLQIDDVELIIELSTPLYYLNSYYNSALANPDFLGLQSQVTPGVLPMPGDYIKGYELYDISQSQLALTQIFSQILGADNMTCLLELAMIKIHGMPDKSELRLEAPGTYRSGHASHAGGGVWNGEFEGVEEDASFGDDFSWGYVAMGKLDYLNLFKGINFSPRVIFTHDVEGTTPTPVNLFIEDRMSANINLGFDYQNKLSFEAGTKIYWGGDIANGLSDRDYVYVNFKYFL